MPREGRGQAAGAVQEGVCGIVNHTLERGKHRESLLKFRKVKKLDSWEEIS